MFLPSENADNNKIIKTFIVLQLASNLNMQLHYFKTIFIQLHNKRHPLK